MLIKVEVFIRVTHQGLTRPVRGFLRKYPKPASSLNRPRFSNCIRFTRIALVISLFLLLSAGLASIVLVP